MGRILSRSLGIIPALLLLTACQSPDMAVGALPPHIETTLSSSWRSATDGIPASSVMPSGAIAEPPSGFVAFCKRDPDQCRETASGTPFVVLTAAVWQTLRTVNAAWNAGVKPEEDAAHYGRIDFWTIPRDGYGDCEDYTLGKRKSLIDLGFSAQALRIATVRTEDGTPHAVLTVATDHGDYVLDNLHGEILPWTSSGYTWIARQAPGQRQWVFITMSQTGGAIAATSQIVSYPGR